MDFFYSARADETNYLIGALMENPKMRERTYGMALTVAYYQRVGIFPIARQEMDWEHRPRQLQDKEIKELQWLWGIATNLREFDEYTWESFYAKRKEPKPKALAVPRITLNITKLEALISKPVHHPNRLQQSRSEILKSRNIGQQLIAQLQMLFKSKIAPPFSSKVLPLIETTA